MYVLLAVVVVVVVTAVVTVVQNCYALQSSSDLLLNTRHCEQDSNITFPVLNTKHFEQHKDILNKILIFSGAFDAQRKPL